MCHIVKVVKRSQRSLADQVAFAFANKQPFDILANDRTTINVPANTAAAQMKAAYAYPGRRDRLGHYAPRCRDITNTQPIRGSFENPDAARGVAQFSAGFVGIQSYPSSPWHSGMCGLSSF